ncbi:polysaccharide deacetylase family protein [Paenibacillus sp. 1P07SE]|uniref:polysaccharide deacetylase family protein n=1 Tax=Paenibacillus sp. 1P07SE TaxID=3132209 RepID=UPI0039A5678B
MNGTRLLLLLILPGLLCGFEGPVIKKDRYYYERKGEIVWEVPTQDKKIALTFDDGPYPPSTSAILDLLDQYDARATFFVVGNRVQRYADLVRREINEGHEVANHTYNHAYFSRNSDPAKMHEEIVLAEKALHALDVPKPSLFRPPGGYYNEAMIHKARRLGYTTVLWSWHQDTKDWRKPGIQAIVDKVLNNARNGDIVLFHDYVPGSMETIEALKQILPELKSQGYALVTVSELLASSKSLPIQTKE